MQLVLLDTTDTSTCSNGLLVDKKHLCPTMRKRRRDDDFNDEDTLRNELISEIMTEDATHMYVELRREDEATRRMEITVNPGGRKSLFENLWDRYQERVKISVFVKQFSSHENGEAIDETSAEGMTIDPHTFTCVGTVSTGSASLKSTSTKRHVKVVADVSEAVLAQGLTPIAQKVLENELFTDLIITAGNGAEVKAHKSFLSASGPVLEAMLRSGMEESQTGVLDMSDISEQGVRAFLRFVYHGDVKMPRANIQIAYELLYASHKYGVAGLEAAMRNCLKDRRDSDFTVAMAFKIYMFVRNIDSAVDLKTKMIYILKEEVDELETLQEYKDLYEKPSNAKIAMEIFKDFVKSI